MNASALTPCNLERPIFPETKIENICIFFGLYLWRFKWYRRKIGGMWEHWIIDGYGTCWFRVNKWSEGTGTRPAGLCRGTPTKEKYLVCSECKKNYELTKDVSNQKICDNCIDGALARISKK